MCLQGTIDSQNRAHRATQQHLVTLHSLTLHSLTLVIESRDGFDGRNHVVELTRPADWSYTSVTRSPY